MLGGLIGMIDLAGDPPQLRHVAEWQSWKSISHVLSAIGIAMGGFELYVGLRALGYKANAPALAVVYAIVSMVLRLVEAVIVFAWAKPAIERAMDSRLGGEMIGSVFGFAMVIGTMLGMAWPIIVLVLMTRPAARRACAKPPA
jgi:hypothetical protein